MRYYKIIISTILVLNSLLPMAASAKNYLSVEQTQKLMFPGLQLTKTPVLLTVQQQAKMTEASSVRFAFDGKNVWHVSDGSWFIVDQVVGKHEFITYAVGINPDGSVKLVEVLEYNESYGYEVKEASWLQQFIGKTSQSTIKLNQDIQNISGATLSCKHLADGVKRVMAMYELVLKSH